MMKTVAICISGLPRDTVQGGFYQKCKEAITYIAKHNKVHLFIWYWDNKFNNEDLRMQSFRKYPIDTNFDIKTFELPNIPLTWSSGLFHEMESEFAKQKEQIKHLPGREDLGIYSMCYAIMKCNELRERWEQEHGMVFDCVMRARFDLKRCGPGCTNFDPNADFKIEDFDLNKLWKSHTNFDLKYGMSDDFAFSNSKNMSHYCRVYHHINECSLLEGKHSPEPIFHHHNHKHYEMASQYLLLGL